MGSLWFQRYSWFFAIPPLVFFVSAVGAIHVMRVKANRRLTEDMRVLPFLTKANISRSIDEYKRLYPQGRAYFIWQVSAIGTAVFAGAIVLAELWELAVAK